MFTQCPQCQVAFRITAEVLQQARGQVRCGSCDSAFNALDHLYEEPPNNPGDAGGAGHDSQALLQTLNRLAGPEEVRIEDTGVEWLVVDEEDVQPGESAAADATGSIKWFLEETGDGDVSPLPEVADQVPGGPRSTEFDPETADTAEQPVIDEQAAVALEAAAQAEPEEARYDDNTPLPDDFEEQHNYVPATQTPMRRATDVAPENDETQAELELSEPGDWMDLLDEFATGSAGADADEADAPGKERAAATATPPETTSAPASQPPAADLPLDVEEELAAIHGELSTLSDPGNAAPADLEVRDEDLDITLDTDLGEQAGQASDEALPDDDDQQEGDVSIVASQLDELLEAMGSGKFKSPDVGALAEPDAEPDTGGDALTLVGDDVPTILGLADDADVEPGEAPGAESEAGADEPDDAGEESGIVYEESTGEFERAIADAEDEILAAADADAEDSTSDDEERATDDDEITAPTAAESDADDDNQDVGQEDAAPADERIDGRDDESSDDEQDDDSNNGARDRDDNADDKGRDGDDPDTDVVDDIAAMTGNMQIDADVLRAMREGNLDPSMIGADGAPIVETIVMEGDFVRGALLGDGEDDEEFSSSPRKRPEQLQDPGSLIDTYISNRDSGTKPGLFSGKRGIAGAVLLLVLLAVQLLHASRETLATYGLFNQTLGPVYRMFGEPVTPTWNIKGWQFEATSGSTNETDSLLTVSSRIANRSAEALPYPLVHISLTDRYEEIMGSKVLEPDEYLAGSADPSRPVAPGDSFTAVISIASPAEEATGFKLNVCYRVAPGRVRCAIEDFKAP